MVKFAVNSMLESWPNAIIESVGDGCSITKEEAYECEEFFVFKDFGSRVRWHDSDTSVEPMIHIIVSENEITIVSELDVGEAAALADEVNEKINALQQCIGDA